MIKNKILFVLLTSFWAFTSNAQNINGNVSMEDAQNPNASKGGAGGQLTNVDLYTGTASVNIPLHSFSVDGIGAGVSLSYVAKGIRVDEMASSVGLGWNLNAGGSITRETFGIEDEVTLPAYFKQCADIYPTPDPSTYDSLQGILVPGANSTDPCLVQNKDDKQHDNFHVNLLGRSFSFAMKRDGYGNIVYATTPYSELKIELITETWDPTLSYVVSSLYNEVGNKGGTTPYDDIIKFTITDERGNKYYFERGDYRYKEYEVDTSNFYNPEGNYYATESWNLVKAVTNTGKEFDFIYEKTDINYLETITETLYQHEWENVDVNTQTVYFDPLEIKEHYWDGVKTHLKEIHYPNGTKVYFDIANDNTSGNTARIDCKGDYILDKIRVEQLDKTFTFDLKHAYFNSTAYGYSNSEIAYNTNVSTVTGAISFPTTADRDEHQLKGMRLKLTGIDRIGFDNTSTEMLYDFNYFSVPLPYRFSPHKDYYGFYNGKSPAPYIRDNFFSTSIDDTFYLSIPYHTEKGGTYTGIYNVHSNNWGLDRSHDHSYATAWILNQITNANGGSEVLSFQDYTLLNETCQYDDNDAYSCAVIDPNVEGANVNDGLCIDAVQYINGIDPTHNYRIEYVLDSGQRFYRGGYTYYKQPGNDTGKVIRTNYFTDPHDYYGGSNHGFQKVTVRKEGYLNHWLSEQTFYYSGLLYYDSNYQFNNNMRSSIFKETGDAYRNLPGNFNKQKVGRLLKQIEYDKNNNILTEHDYNYEERQRPTYSVSINNVSYSSYNPALYAAVYLTNSTIVNLTSETISRHLKTIGTLNSTQVSTSYTYKYDDHYNLNTIIWTDSDGNTYKKYKKYNYDYSTSIPNIGALNNNDLQFIISNEVWKMGISDSSLLDLGVNAPVYNNGQIHFKAHFGLVNSEPMASTTAQPMSGGSATAIKLDNALDYQNHTDYGSLLLKFKEFTVLDNDGNVVEKRLNDQDIYTSSIYNDNYQKTAEAVNANVEDIAFTSFELHKGKWSYNDSHVNNSQYMTGTRSFDLIEGINDIHSGALNNISYIVAFWINSTAIPVAEVVNPGGTDPVTLTHQNTVGDWYLYTAEITPDAGGYFKLYNNTPTISMLVDEMRLHPSAASMTTYTYAPLCGVTSQSDNQNYINYYEYDEFGRVVLTRTMRGEILSKKEHFTQDPDN